MLLALELLGPSNRLQPEPELPTVAGTRLANLVLELPGGALWAIEVKFNRTPKLARGFHEARGDLKPARTFVVSSGADRYPLADGIEVIGLRELTADLAGLRLG